LPGSNFFPIGTYGANSTNLEEIKNLGVNSAVVGLNRVNIEKCLSLNMRCTLSVPRDPERLIRALDTFESLLQQGNFSYYVNDEPGIHSFSEGQAEDIQRIIKKRFPNAVTNMAIVHPQVIPFYEKGADYFMLDQYPVPNMPMSWLSDSMDEAALHVGRGRLQSVIHGSRGIYFFTYPSITSTPQGKVDFARLLRRLNGMRSWLQVGNAEQDIAVRMISKNRFDPRGNPAVHCATKEQYNTKMLICTNTIRTHTEAELDIAAGSKDTWQEYFTGESYPVVDGNMRVRFAPLEVRVLIESH